MEFSPLPHKKTSLKMAGKRRFLLAFYIIGVLIPAFSSFSSNNCGVSAYLHGNHSYRLNGENPSKHSGALEEASFTGNFGGISSFQSRGIFQREHGNVRKFSSGKFDESSSLCWSKHEVYASRLAAAPNTIKPLVSSTDAISQSSEEQKGRVCVPLVSSNPLENYVYKRGGDRPIKKILVANNGMAAVKFVLSVKKWLQDVFEDDKLIEFYGMVSSDDLKASANFIEGMDGIFEVPGGVNRQNYANVDLIVEAAKKFKVDAVWPGWGHASENPLLPQRLSEQGIKFIGPGAYVMGLLGDKIAANLLAQSAGVPSIPWSGDGITVDLKSLDSGKGVEKEVYDRARVSSAEDCFKVAERIGYPFFIKASSGGGGKGIRRVNTPEEVRSAYDQVVAEVPDSPVFLMGVCSDARHIEVQIVGDAYGKAVSLSGRDCSTQRRFQKIFEEGPPSIVPEEVFKKMERAAQNLTSSIGYQGAGTVEFMYIPKTEQYYFLELNPRLQVEHPVTEGITDINLPAAQLHVAMGIPLSKIPDIRSFWGKTPLGTEEIDFVREEHIPITKHVIAARITAENSDEAFKPTSGRVDKLKLQTDQNSWAYFSVDAGGSVHEYADSQFGHLFATGNTREESRKKLVSALKTIQVRGDICTPVELLRLLLDSEAFKNNEITTTWLDGIIADRSIAVEVDDHEIVMAAALSETYKSIVKTLDKAMSLLSRGHVSTPGVNQMNSIKTSIVYKSKAYNFSVSRVGKNDFLLSLDREEGETTPPEGTKKSTPQGGDEVIPVHMLQQPNGTLLATYNGRTRRILSRREALGIRVTLDGSSVFLPDVKDPSKLRADAGGKVIKYLIPSESKVVAGEGYVQVDSMKILRTLKAEATGKLIHRKVPGSLVQAGDLLATIELEDPSEVKPVTPFTGRLLESSREASEGRSSPTEDRGIGFYRGVQPPSRNPMKLEEVYHRLKMTVKGYSDVLCNEDLAVFEEEMLSNGVLPPSDNLIFGGKTSAVDENLKAEDGAKAVESKKRQFEMISDVFTEYLKVEELLGERSEDEVIQGLLDEGREVEDVLHMKMSLAGAGARSKIVAKLIILLQRFADKTSSYHLVADSYLNLLKRLSALKSKNSANVALEAIRLVKFCSSLKGANKEAIPPSSPHSEKGDETTLSVRISSQNTPQNLSRLEGFVGKTYEKFGVDRVEADRFPLPAGGGYGSALFWKFHPQNYSNAGKPEEVAKKSEGCLMAVKSMEDLKELPRLLNGWTKQMKLESGEGDEEKRNTLHIVIEGGKPIYEGSEREREYLRATTDIVEELQPKLLLGGVRFVEVLVRSELGPERVFNFRLSGSSEYVEMPSQRDLRALDVELLEMQQLYSEFDIKKLSVGCLSFLDIPPRSVFLAESKAHPPRPLLPTQKLLSRSAIEIVGDGKEVFSAEDTHTLESHFNGLLDELEEAAANPKVSKGFSSSIFVHLKTPFLSGQADAAKLALTRFLHQFTTVNSERLLKLHVDKIEFKAHLQGASVVAQQTPHPPHQGGSKASSPIESLRYVGVRSSQFWRLSSYNEKVDAVTGETLLLSPQSVSTGDNHNVPCDERGAMIDAIETSKRAIARNAGTTYVYDFLPMLETSVWRHWMRTAVNSKELEAEVPTDLIQVEEIGLSSNEKDLVFNPPSFPRKETEELSIKAFKVLMKVPEYHPDGRTIIFIVSDITHQNGSLGVKEDEFFAKVSELARSLKVPRIYVAANSGARIGIFKDLMDKVKVSWKDPKEPSSGLDYLYLDEAGYSSFDPKVIEVERIVVNGEVRYKLLAIIGPEDLNIGVENLRGSGLIAGETSLAYKDIFTLSYVSGRSVGIGAYVVRLGQRVIQAKDATLLLTGYQALNKLLGKHVYTSQMQIGGPGIMLQNGISHLEVDNDQAGLDEIVRWLSFVAKTSTEASAYPAPIEAAKGSSQEKVAGAKSLTSQDAQSRGIPEVVLPSATSKLNNSDPVDREITYKPSLSSGEDVRKLFTGTHTPGEVDFDGFFDRDSFKEYLAGWGKGVVVGRAKLGGIPVGVIGVETRTVESRIAADPANIESSNTKSVQAGQVWFPDSAFKTAQAIEDFNYGEKLPLFIFANWKGFSGGTRDMLDEVMKFGAKIVDALSNYGQPVFIYLPPRGELRGGSWVVLDESINSNVMEMYADEDSNAGILEPPAVCEIKFKWQDKVSMMGRVDDTLIALKKKTVEDPDNPEIMKAYEDRQKALMPSFTQVAEHYAALHDRPARMKARGAIHGIIPWKNARTFFYWRLRLRLIELALMSRMQPNSGFVHGNDSSALERIRNLLPAEMRNREDKEVVEYLSSPEGLDLLTAAIS